VSIKSVAKLHSVVLIPAAGTSLVDTNGNLLPVSLATVVPVTKFTTDVVDTCGKFAIGVGETNGAP
jgi:hypothetical protein